MSFRTKIFLVFLITVLASVSVVAYGVTRYTRAAFEEMDAQRTEALVAQFKKEFAQRGDQIVQQVKNITDAEITLRVAIDLARPNADQSLYVREATGAAQDHGLDFVEFVNSDGTLISSAQYPSRVGYKNDWVAAKDWSDSRAFLKKEELPDGMALSLAAVRALSGGNGKNLYIIGGVRLDQNFLSSLVLPSGMRALLYRNLGPALPPRRSQMPMARSTSRNAWRRSSNRFSNSRKRWSAPSIGARTPRRRKHFTRYPCQGAITNSSAFSWSAARAGSWCC
jgi:hypothetical protein